MNDFGTGTVINDSWIVTADIFSGWTSEKFPGYKLPDWLLDELVDKDIAWVVFIDPKRGRYTSSVEDWQDYALWDDGILHLQQSRFTYG